MDNLQWPMLTFGFQAENLIWGQKPIYSGSSTHDWTLTRANNRKQCWHATSGHNQNWRKKIPQEQIPLFIGHRQTCMTTVHGRGGGRAPGVETRCWQNFVLEVQTWGGWRTAGSCLFAHLVSLVSMMITTRAHLVQDGKPPKRPIPLVLGTWEPFVEIEHVLYVTNHVRPHGHRSKRSSKKRVGFPFCLLLLRHWVGKVYQMTRIFIVKTQVNRIIHLGRALHEGKHQMKLQDIMNCWMLTRQRGSDTG